MRHTLLLLSVIFSLASAKGEVVVGADRLDKLLPLLDNKRVALVVNHTSVLANGTHLVDTLATHNVDIKRLFAPEHGLRGNADAGEHVNDGIDARTGVPIVSLYGKNKRPSAKQLEDIDVIVFDIQDVGARFYTYISTLYYLLEEVGKAQKEIIVLDRPNPCDYVSGPILNDSLRSFVGALPLPILHGLTVGELATLVNGEKWVSSPLALTVIPLQGWKHGEAYSLPIKPSPNLPSWQSVALYASLCPFEGTIISVGRGTTTPFQVIGYPDKRMGGYRFTPQSLPGFDKNPMYNGQVCYGISLQEATPPQGFTLDYVIEAYHRLGKPQDFFKNARFFDLLVGDVRVRKMIMAGKSSGEIAESWQEGLQKYRILRQKYLLYP